MQRKWMYTLFTALLLLLSVVSISAHDDLEGAEAIFISGAWARPTAMDAMTIPESTPEAGAMDHSDMGMGGVSGAYLFIENMGDPAVRLIAASSPVAGTVELHESRVVDNVAQMNPVEGGITIQHEEAVALQPGGLHIMLMDLLMPLLPGSAIQLTLTFETLGADGNPVGEPFAVVIGALVQMEPPGVGVVAVQNAWARPTVAAMDTSATPEGGMNHSGMSMSDVSAAYMTLLNRGEADDRLVSVSTPAATLVEIHESKVVDNVMQMNPVEGGLLLPVDDAIKLVPGGLHIMLMELTGPLVPASAIPLTLTFESGASFTIAVPVYDAMAMAM
jgi:copper(I)-binding protein